MDQYNEHEHMEGEATYRIHGMVKWFDVAKGYGFVTAQNAQGDVLLHLSCLRQAGLSSIREGASVICDAVKRVKGDGSKKDLGRLGDIDDTIAFLKLDANAQKDATNQSSADSAAEGEKK